MSAVGSLLEPLAGCVHTVWSVGYTGPFTLGLGPDRGGGA